MPAHDIPGVSIEESSGGPMPLSPAGTAVAAFMGFTEKDPNGADQLKPRLVTDWIQYQDEFGGFMPSALLPIAVHGFFANGGTRCYIVPSQHLHDMTADVGNEMVDRLPIPEDVTMVLVPDLITVVLGPEKMASVLTGGEQYAWDTWTDSQKDMWKRVQNAVIRHCEIERNRLAILDPPPGLSARDMEAFDDWAGYDSRFATMYYPWLQVDDPTTATPAGTMDSIFIPPCGHMAGIWTRNDDTRGVFKAPANVSVREALDVQLHSSELDREGLISRGINVIRSSPGSGLEVWGARTLSKTDPSWPYINVRRLFNMIETSIMDGTRWVVSEPNDEETWDRVKRIVDAFLLGLWRDGALFGTSSSEAFVVKCDAETNPPESVDDGKLIIEVGIAPVKPGEFVIFRISQEAQSSAS